MATTLTATTEPQRCRDAEQRDPAPPTPRPRPALILRRARRKGALRPQTRARWAQVASPRREA